MRCIEMVFSPTGGTAKAARAVASALADDIEFVDLSDRAFDFSAVEVSSDDVVLVAMPCFGGRAPSAAMERLAAVYGASAPCVVMSVYGNRAFDDALVEMVDGARKAELAVIAAVAAVAEHSIMPQYASGRPGPDDEERLGAIGREIRDALDEGRPVDVGLVSGNRPYKKDVAVPLVPQPKKTCAACGRCAASCPVGAIDAVTYRADKDRCIACMRCLKECPAQARSVNKLLVKAAAAAIKKQATLRKPPELFAVPA